jgi:hypothetical protein
MIYNICMGNVKLLQVRGKIYNICMAKFTVAHVRGGYTTFVWLSLECNR